MNVKRSRVLGIETKSISKDIKSELDTIKLVKAKLKRNQSQGGSGLLSPEHFSRRLFCPFVKNRGLFSNSGPKKRLCVPSLVQHHISEGVVASLGEATLSAQRQNLLTAVLPARVSRKEKFTAE